MEIQRHNSTLTKAGALPDLLRLLSSSDHQVTPEMKAGALVRQQRDLTPHKALDSQKLASLKKTDPGCTAEAVAALLHLTAKQFNVKRPLTDLQLELLTAQILQKWYFLSFDELSYIMREALAYRWGQVYDHLDGPMILDWINQYCEQERQRIVRDRQEQERIAGQQRQLSKIDLAVLGYNVGELTEEERREGQKRYDAAQAAKFAQDKATTENLFGKKHEVKREPETQELIERVRKGLEAMVLTPEDVAAQVTLQALALRYGDYYERRGQVKCAALCRDYAARVSQ